MLLTSSLRLAIIARALWRGPRSRGKEECIGDCQAMVDKCERLNTGEMAHSRLVVRKLK